MITKEISLCGKPVTLGYCYATDISYKKLANQDITDFCQEAVQAIQADRMPDAEKTIYAILACMLAYYQSRDEDNPIRDADIMNEATPLELGTALGTVLTLRMEFYNIPAGEPEDKPQKGKGKKGKN